MLLCPTENAAPEEAPPQLSALLFWDFLTSLRHQKTPLIMPHIYIVKAYILCRRDAQGAGSGVCELTHQSGLSDDRS